MLTDKTRNVNFIFLRTNQLVIKACILCFGLCLHHGPLDGFSVTGTWAPRGSLFQAKNINILSSPPKLAY